MVTNYTTKCYIKSGSGNASRKLLVFTHKKSQLNIFQHAGKFAQFTPLRLAFALLSQVFKNSFLGYFRFS